MNKVVAFDLDGTLIESDLYLLPAYRGALMRMDMPPMPDSTLIRMIGGTYEDNRLLIMPDRPAADFDLFCGHIVDIALETIHSLGHPYPRIPQVLDELQSDGYLTILCSNGDPDYVDPILDAMGLRPHLSHIQRIGRGMNKSQLLASIIRDFDAQGKTAMVGDRSFDAVAARDNGAFFCGCLYGIFPEEIMAAEPDALLASPSELPDAVRRLLP